MNNLSNAITICIGSNCGDRLAAISSAITGCRHFLNECKVSDIYETPEIHGKGAPYLNAVLSGRCDKDFAEMQASFKQMEIDCGRDELCRQQGRVPLDIDIVIWNSDIVRPSDFAQSFFQLGYSQL